MPLRSNHQAEFLHHEVPGIDIPKHVRERLAELGNEDAPKCGVEVAQNLLVEVKPRRWGLPHAPGFGPPFGRERHRTDNLSIGS
jgi:hypothetical protein